MIMSCCAHRVTEQASARERNSYSALTTVEDTPALAIAVTAYEPPMNITTPEAVETSRITAAAAAAAAHKASSVTLRAPELLNETFVSVAGNEIELVDHAVGYV